MLPITPIIPELSNKIAKQDCILVAPPGAGKSTYLPIRLLALEAFKGQQIIMLQPRQVAVRGIAQYLSAQIGETVGGTIGYQMRGEAKHSKNTKLLIMTEGLLSTRIQNDPELTGVGLIIFDEFHERSVYSDIALGLSIEVQQGLRDDLRLLVMSATLEIAPVQKLLHSPAVFESQGRGFPIDYIYRPQIGQAKSGPYQSPKAIFVRHVVNVINEAVNEQRGHILVFLPGAAQINNVLAAIKNQCINDKNQLVIMPLYGGLSPQAQQEAINPPPHGKRKIVLATNIAETSLTIDGVSIVIDSGLEKVQSLNLARKANQLNEQMISKSSSIQRAGRSGRQQSGICYRLWSEQQQQFLIEKSLPQITQIDISPYLLSLLEWGSSFNDLPLIDKPSQAQIDYALDNLRLFDFVDAKGAITTLGKRAAKLNTAPRLAMLMLAPVNSDAAHTQAPNYIKALMSAIIEGKPLSRETNTIDIQGQLRYLLNHKNHILHKEVKRWSLAIKKQTSQSEALANNNLSLLSYIESSDFAVFMLNIFPDRIGLNRGDNSYVLTNGIGVSFYAKHSEQTAVVMPKWIICIDLAVKGKAALSQSNNTRYSDTSVIANNEIRLYLTIPNSVMESYIAEHQQTQSKLVWDDKLQKVSARKVNTLHAINLSQQTISMSDAFSLNENANSQSLDILLLQIRKRGLSSFLNQSTHFLHRAALAAKLNSNSLQEFPNMSTAALESTLQNWLPPYLHKVSSMQELQNLDWQGILKAMLSWEQQQFIDAHFPTHYTAPSGNKHKLIYHANGEVELAIRLQELYGLSDTPNVGQGKQAVTLSLLSPAHREIQKTKDLKGFWHGSYKEVQKEMKGRYPKHFWPDSPATSQATTKTKKNM